MIGRSMDIPSTQQIPAAHRPLVPSPREPLSPRHGRAAPVGYGSDEDELLERTLAFSGTYVSDDGGVAVRRVAVDPFAYDGHRFLGNCLVCARARVLPPAGQPLADVPAASRFVSAHSHGDVD